jgi:hypothetical protein
MQTSAGTELPEVLQAAVDHLWVKCVTCPISSRQALWETEADELRTKTGTGIFKTAMEDALQDAGFRLGIFRFNAQAARFYGAAMGSAEASGNPPNG